MGSISTLIYTSELILCSTICVHSATRHNIHMYLSLRCDSPPKSSPTFSVRLRSSVGRATVDLIRRSWVRFPPRSKYFFSTSCVSLIPFTRANAQWVIHGVNQHFNLHFRVNSLFHPFVFIVLRGTTLICTFSYMKYGIHVLHSPLQKRESTGASFLY